MDVKSEGTVLVVDDDPNAVDILTRMLTKEGFKALPAHSGAEALDVVARQPVDVILLDVMMPEMDGFQVCAKLQANESTRDIAVILVTARDDLETRVTGMRLGVSEFIAKPINKRDLFERVRAQIHQRSIEHGIDRMLTE
jgi:DNA-binding response OmpR family regulator